MRSVASAAVKCYHVIRQMGTGMKRLKLTLALALSLIISVTAGCEFLPPLPSLPWLTLASTATSEVPADLTEAADLIWPSTVIVDTRYATGTGWVLDESGIIVTNFHVIENARSITVTLHDGRRLSVRSVASDPISDLAVLFVDAHDLTAAVIGSSASLRVGDSVVAVGNSNGDGISVKTGNVTRLNMTVSIESQDFYGLIENNTPIQHGDSGGPLVNQAGEVVGISNAKVIGLREIAYAINIDSAMPILYELINAGTVSWPYLGIVGSDNPAGRGALIGEISPGSPADEAGLMVGDIIFYIDGVSVAGMTDLRQYILSQKVGQNVIIAYRRDGMQTETALILGQRPN